MLAAGGAAEFDKLVAIYEGAKSQELRIAVLSALGASKDPTLVRRALEFNLTDKARESDGQVTGLVSYSALQTSMLVAYLPLSSHASATVTATPHAHSHRHRCHYPVLAQTYLSG